MPNSASSCTTTSRRLQTTATKVTATVSRLTTTANRNGIATMTTILRRPQAISHGFWSTTEIDNFRYSLLAIPAT
jgi:hypothetical protein